MVASAPANTPAASAHAFVALTLFLLGAGIVFVGPDSATIRMLGPGAACEIEKMSANWELVIQ